MTRFAASHRRGLTLAELLIATAITTMVVGALGVLTRAVMDGLKQTNKAGNATQAARVVLSRMSHAISTSRQVLITSTNLRWSGVFKTSLLVWERDGEPDDATPGQPNWVEVVIYTRSSKSPGNLLELRPKVDPSLVVPLDSAQMMKYWINRFRSERDIEQPPVVVLNHTGGLNFEIVEMEDPHGIAEMIQQDIRIRLCISPPDQEPTAFFASATRRYVPSASAEDWEDED